MIDRETTSLEALSIAIRAEKEANRLIMVFFGP